MVAVRADTVVLPAAALPITPAWSGNGPRPRPRYRQDPVSVASLAGAGRELFTGVTWREGARGAMRSHFAALRVRPAGVMPQRLALAVTKAAREAWDGVLPGVWLLAE